MSRPCVVTAITAAALAVALMAGPALAKPLLPDLGATTLLPNLGVPQIDTQKLPEVRLPEELPEPKTPETLPALPALPPLPLLSTPS
jgi:hypothetical protein